MTGHTETTGNARIIPWNTFANMNVNEILPFFVDSTIGLTPADKADPRAYFLVGQALKLATGRHCEEHKVTTQKTQKMGNRVLG